MTPLPPGPPPPAWLIDPHAALGDLAQHATAALTAGAVVVAAAASAGLVIAVGRRLAARRMRRDARQIHVLAPPAPDLAGAEALWANLHDLLRPAWRRLFAGQPHLAWQYAWSHAGLRITVWVPGGVPHELVERAIESAWPAARTETVRASEPLPSGLVVCAGSLTLAETHVFPLRTQHDSDPLRALLGAAATANEREHVVVQIAAQPATSRAVGRLRRAARALRAESPKGTSSDPTVGPDVRAILDKADAPLWRVAVRYAVASPSGARRAASQRRGRAHAVASAFAVFAGRNRLRRRRLRRPAAALARRALWQASLLSGRELAALAHLPTDPAVPGLPRAGARAVPPPVDVPRDGVGAKVLGDTDAGPGRAVALAASDARYHLHVMGATGSGKSTLLTNLVLQDIDAGRGCVVVDPKGDLITDVLARLPRAERSRAVVLDPRHPGPKPTLNMLEVPAGVDQELVVDHLVSIFHRIFEHHWGPRTDEVVRAACLTLLKREGAHLGLIPDLLTNRTVRGDYVRELLHPQQPASDEAPPDEAAHARLDGADPAHPPTDADEPAEGPENEPDPGSALLSGFWKWYEAQSDAQRSQVIGSALNKLRAFLLRGFVREIVSTPRSTLDIAQVLDGGLLLVGVPKGLLGDDTARLLGSFVVARVWQAATGRASLGEQARSDASLYIDECHNFLTLPNSVADMLAEARGYRLSMVLAHQHLGQMPREMRDALSANARNKILFTMSPEDAHVLERHVAPELNEHDLSHLGGYQAACRLVVAGQDQPAFTIRTRPLTPGVRR